jgi:hypothetical protein
MNMALINDLGDSKVTIKRTDLLTALKENQTKHAAEYKEAYEGYKVAFVTEAERLVVRAKEGKFDIQVIALAAPQDHSKDYNRVIRMMEMCTADEIIVSESQFSQYVLDEWNWQANFKATAMAYSGRR